MNPGEDPYSIKTKIVLKKYVKKKKCSEKKIDQKNRLKIFQLNQISLKKNIFSKIQLKNISSDKKFYQ